MREQDGRRGDIAVKRRGMERRGVECTVDRRRSVVEGVDRRAALQEGLHDFAGAASCRAHDDRRPALPTLQARINLGKVRWP
jgi:hypothetical protein